MTCCKGVVPNKGNNGCYLLVYLYFNSTPMEKFSLGQRISLPNKVLILVGHGKTFEFPRPFATRGKG